MIKVFSFEIFIAQKDDSSTVNWLASDRKVAFADLLSVIFPEESFSILHKGKIVASNGQVEIKDNETCYYNGVTLSIKEIK